MYLVVEGPIGVGKTSLARRLSARYAAELSLEVVEENPFLASFYRQPQVYAFQVQVFFLLSRFKQLSALAQGGLFTGSMVGSGNVVGDYLFAKDFIFAAMNLQGHEFELYRDLYAHLSPRLPTPDLVVYLRAEPEVLLRRIQQRGRPYEQTMQAAYLEELSARYDEFFVGYRGRVLPVPAGDIDFVSDAQQEAELLARIHAALGAESAAD